MHSNYYFETEEKNKVSIIFKYFNNIALDAQLCDSFS